MRILGRIPHSSFTITIFGMNDKTILKIEAGPMEQVYKFKTEDMPGVEAVEKFLTEEFLSGVHARFNDMYLSMKKKD